MKRLKEIKYTWFLMSLNKQMKKLGIMRGYEDGTFRLNEGLTCAEDVTVLNRLFNRGQLIGSLSLPLSDVPESYWAYAEILEASTTHSSYDLNVNGEEIHVDKE